MVSSTLCPAVPILGSQNVYSRAEGIVDHNWPWADFFHYAMVATTSVRKGVVESLYIYECFSVSVRGSACLLYSVHVGPSINNATTNVGFMKSFQKVIGSSNIK